ncbi:hypothetical protein [Crateriforma conspicua]|uniref:Uncharacterized protein n=1 Tax=Crateriforma conspicua TaxID=2527996 RepID=A0A5C5YE95_9PLAN|nr:hypothetical protein [Crateriforma conspicua]TWT72615.1 hypothetical protein Pan14r_49350 [Crateriforma conspicua]
MLSYIEWGFSRAYVVLSSQLFVGAKRGQDKSSIRQLIAYAVSPFVNERREVTI